MGDAATFHLPALAYAGIAALVLARLYLRVRRSIGRQRLRPLRAWLSLVFFPGLVLALVASAASHPTRALAELAGVAAGVGLAFWGLRLTKFEHTPEGLFYTPHVFIGLALTSLFVLRIAYRFAQAYIATEAFTTIPLQLARSPLTLAIVGLLAGYYAAYAFGLIRWQRSVRQAAL